jgi:hypothetical protein
MAKFKKPPKPTIHQAQVLRQIANAGGGLCLTRTPDDMRYHDQAGRTIATPTAMVLIRNGWVKAQRDSMFDLDPQTWRVLSAASSLG